MENQKQEIMEIVEAYKVEKIESEIVEENVRTLRELFKITGVIDEKENT